jgi:tripartite-type tricarboxylate transporter receptor subunit TctC
MRRWHLSYCSVLVWAVLSQVTHGQAPSTFPTRPITFVVSTPAGGATDTVARLVASELTEVIGQSVLVENRTGGNFQIAWNHVAGSTPDGHVLSVAENALSMNKALYRRPFDPLTQFDAIARVSLTPMVLVVAANIPANSVAELVALVKSNPKKMNYASAGAGSVGHLLAEVFLKGAGIEVVHVPYRGGGPALNDVVAGHVPMVVTSVSIAKGYVASKRLKALALMSSRRSPVLPDVPTFDELGIPTGDVELDFWNGVFAPAGTPTTVKATLEQALAETLARPRIVEKMKTLDIYPAFAPGSELHALLARDVASWIKFIDQHGIKAE